MPNRLASSASPYLRQHADNPVDWHEWGPEALALARATGRPILLSIGYSACHWCHVMAHESFEDPATAAVMNELFVNIKVDREERPDLDAIYMQAVTALSGHGGWPMTVFLTPDCLPFHGGTYFPPTDRHGLPSFQRVLRAVSSAWKSKPGDVIAAGRALEAHLHRAVRPTTESREVGGQDLQSASRALARSFDAHHAGFGGAPKFPPTMSLDFLLRHWWRTGDQSALGMVQRTFTAMVRGGIFDQLGGGLHRYSVDEAWLVPHFEKMLYDNALLARLGVHLWQARRDPEVRSATIMTLDWVAREMRDARGGFFSSLDADSEGHEGRFYLWDSHEVASACGADAAVALAHWGISDAGNFEGRNILCVPLGMKATAARTGLGVEEAGEAVERARARLLELRARRQRPARDDKIVASWNGLMIRAFAVAARAFGSDNYLAVAVSAGDFIHRELVQGGRVLRSALGDRRGGPGFLEDHAAIGLAFLDLHSLTLDATWLSRSREILQGCIESFRDPGSGDWFDTAHDAEQLIVRPRDFTDNATPSGSSLTAEFLLAWANLDDRDDYREMSAGLVSRAGEGIASHPLAFGHLACVADSLVNGSAQMAIVGSGAAPAARSLAEVVGRHYLPSLVLAAGPGGEEAEVALLRGRGTPDGEPLAYLCRDFTCELPAADAEALEGQLARLAGGTAGR